MYSYGGKHHTIDQGEGIINRESWSTRHGQQDLSLSDSPTAYDPIGEQEARHSARTNTMHSMHRFPERDEVDISHVKVTDPALDQPDAEDPTTSRPQSAALLVGAPSLPSTAYHTRPTSSRTTNGYAPVSPVNTSSNESRGLAGRLRSIKALTSGKMIRRDAIQEGDEMELGLRGAAYQIGTAAPGYTSIEDDDDDERGNDKYGVDLSVVAGHRSTESSTVAAQNRQLEANGTLTGGLGRGMPDVETISMDDLYASSPIVESTRRLSRIKTRRLNRAPTFKEIGQAEANRRGKAIEIVVEEVPPTLPTTDSIDEEDFTPTPGVDLSMLAGEMVSGGGYDSPVGTDGAPRTATMPMPTRAQPLRRETFYPVANWKPFTMKWPYLTWLIVVSIALGGAQEYLYRLSAYKLGMTPPQGLFTFNNPQDVADWDFFCFKYLPSMVTVTYGIMWQFADFEVKRLEPYHHLSKEGGALAAESINVDYITIFNFWRPFRAMRHRHYAITISSSAAFFAMSLVPVLQAASVQLLPDRSTRLAHPDEPKFIVINSLYSRSLTSILIFMAFLGSILLVMLQRRRSGLVGDVKGIAGIAAMATKSHILMDFRDLDTALPQDIHNKLKDRRYMLRNASLSSDDRISLANHHKDRFSKPRMSQNPHPFMLRLSAGIPIIIFIAFFLAFLPIVLFTNAGDFMDKSPWILTALAVSVKIIYQTLEQDMRMLEPFFHLSCRHAQPRVLTLDYTGMAFGYMPLRALLNADYLVFLIGFGSVLAEILTVCVSSFAGVNGMDFLPPPPGARRRLVLTMAQNADIHSGEETTLSFWVSFFLSTCITVYLIGTACAAYVLRRHPFLPRQPSTIASVLAYIHQSNMLYDFVSSEEDNDGMVRRLAEQGKTYGLGWFTGRDGSEHCGVDEEELKRGYGVWYKRKISHETWSSTPWSGGDYANY